MQVHQRADCKSCRWCAYIPLHGATPTRQTQTGSQRSPNRRVLWILSVNRFDPLFTRRSDLVILNHRADTGQVVPLSKLDRGPPSARTGQADDQLGSLREFVWMKTCLGSRIVQRLTTCPSLFPSKTSGLGSSGKSVGKTRPSFWRFPSMMTFLMATWAQRRQSPLERSDVGQWMSDVGHGRTYMIAAPSPLMPRRIPLANKPSPVVQSFCKMIVAFNSSSIGYPSVETS